MRRFTVLILVLVLVLVGIPLPYIVPAPVAAQGDPQSVTIDFDDQFPVTTDDGAIVIFGNGIISADSDNGNNYASESQQRLVPVVEAVYGTAFTDNGDGTYTWTGCYDHPISNRHRQRITTDYNGRWVFDWIAPEGSNNDSGNTLTVDGVYPTDNSWSVYSNYGWRVWHATFEPDALIYAVEPGEAIEIQYDYHKECNHVTGALYAADGGTVQLTYHFNKRVDVKSVSFSHRGGTTDQEYMLTLGFESYHYTFDSGSSWQTHSDTVTGAPDGGSEYATLTWYGPIDIDNVTIEYTPHIEPEKNYTYPLLEEDTRVIGEVRDDLWGLDWGSIGQAYRPVYANRFVQPHTIGNYTDAESVDQAPAVTIAGSNEYQLLYLSTDSAALVHSPISAEVKSITRLDSSWCGSPVTYDQSLEIMPDVLNIIKYNQLMRIPYDAAIHFVEQARANLLNLDKTFCMMNADPSFPPTLDWGQDVSILPAGDVVELYDYVNDRTLFYLVANAESFLNVGAVIRPGCVIGQILPAFHSQPIATTFYVPIYESTNGIGVIWAEDADGNPLDIRDDYSIPPYFDTPCIEAGDGLCINANDRFQVASPFGWWTEITPVIVDPDAGGMKFVPGQIARQLLAVPASQDLSVSLSAYVTTPESAGDTVMDVTISSTTESVYIDSGGSQTTAVIPAQSWPGALTPGAAQLSVSMADGQTGAVVVKRLCVSTGAPALEAVDQCVVDDPGFEGSGAWAVTGTGSAIGSGMLTLSSGGEARQLVDLPADNYNMEIRYRSKPGVGAATVDLNWTLYAQDGVTVLDSGVVSDAAPDWTIGSGAWTMQSNDLVYLALTSGAGDDIQIDWVCLTPEYTPIKDPGDPAVWVDPSDPSSGGTGSGSKPPGSPSVSCNACPRYLIGDLTHDVPESISWLECELSDLYWCDARAIMVDTRDNVAAVVRGIGMLGRYFEVAIPSLGYYLGGHLANVIRAAGGGYVVIESGNANLWDVLVSLFVNLRDVLVSLVTELSTSIQALLNSPVLLGAVEAVISVIGLIALVVGFVFSYAQILPGILMALVDGFTSASTTPILIPGAPDCAVTPNNPLCLGFYVLDNTILADGSRFGDMLPVLFGLLSLSVGIWLFVRFKRAIVSA